MSASGEQLTNVDPSLVEKQKEKRKTYFTYWSSHDLENWDLQAQPTITSDELEELEELEQLDFTRYNSIRKTFKGSQETIEIKDGERRTTRVGQGEQTP